jgi:hypothetical protein
MMFALQANMEKLHFFTAQHVTTLAKIAQRTVHLDAVPVTQQVLEH